MTDLNTALIAFVGVLAGGYVNNFLAEDFRRFRDGQALAGALAGELDSHGSAVSVLRPGLDNMLAAIKAGEPLALPEWPLPSSPVFEATVGDIGLLDPELAKDVAFVYEQIRAFRLAFHQLSKHHEHMPKEWRERMVNVCTDRIDSAFEQGEKLVKSLTACAKKSRMLRRLGMWCVPLCAVLALFYFVAIK